MLEEKLFTLIIAGGLPIIFLLLFLESVPILGTFIPGQFIVILVGVLIAATGIYPLYLVFILILIASFLGDVLAFLFAKNLDKSKLKKFGFRKNSIFYKSSHKFFEKFGLCSVILGRQLNPTRAYIPFIAGLSNMRSKVFIFTALFSCILWTTLSLFLGYTFGFLIVDKIAFVFEFITITLFYGAIFIFAFLSYKNFEKKNPHIYKTYHMRNMVLGGIFLIFLTYLIFLVKWGYSPLIDEYLLFVYFPFLQIGSKILLHPLFLVASSLIVFIFLFVKKKYYLLLVFLWSILITSFLTLIFSLLLKNWIGQRPFISIIFITIFIYTIGFFMERSYTNSKMLKHYQYLLIILLLIILLSMYAQTRNSVLVMISFLFGAIICEFITLLSSYGLFNSYNKIITNK